MLGVYLIVDMFLNTVAMRDEHLQKAKKPSYQKVWMWLQIAVMSILLIIDSCMYSSHNEPVTGADQNVSFVELTHVQLLCLIIIGVLMFSKILTDS